MVLPFLPSSTLPALRMISTGTPITYKIQVLNTYDIVDGEFCQYSGQRLIIANLVPFRKVPPR